MGKARMTPIPVDLAAIGTREGGTAAEDLAAAMERLAGALLEYREQWPERARGKKASITLTVEVQIDKENPDLMHCAAEVTLKTPAPPAKRSLATIAPDEETGVPRLVAMPVGRFKDVKGQRTMLMPATG